MTRRHHYLLWVCAALSCSLCLYMVPVTMLYFFYLANLD